MGSVFYFCAVAVIGNPKGQQFGRLTEHLRGKRRSEKSVTEIYTEIIFQAFAANLSFRENSLGFEKN